MKHRILILSLLATATIASAQYNETNNLFYNTFRTPQSNDLNPAFFPNKNTFYLRLPGLGLQFGSPLALNEFVHTQADTATIIDLNQMLDALTEDNRFRFNTDINLLGFGFKIHNTFITFNSRMVVGMSVGIPVSIINTLRQGNVGASGPISEMTLLDGDLLNFQSYLEAGVGVGHHFQPLGLTIGARAKYLYGLANIQTDNSRAVFRTGSGYNSISADLYYEIQSSTAVNFDTTLSLNSIMSQLKDIDAASTGVAFDLGARYDLGPFTFSLAINDLSAGIHWKSNLHTYRPKNDHVTLTFDGQDVSTILHQGTLNTDSIVGYYQDLLQGLTPDSNGVASDYWYSIPTKINLGVSFNFAKMLRAGVLFHGQFDRGLLSKKNTYDLDLSGDVVNTFRFNTTLSLGINLFNWAELIVGSSAVYDGGKVDLFNPGVGIVLTPATVLQTYVMADYISSIYLVENKAFNVKFGLNLLIGKGGFGKVAQN